MTTGATWIRFVHSQEQIKEILDYCAEEKKAERDKVLDLLRPEVLHFALRMERKLRTHDDERGKDGWHEAGAFWLLERLQQEVAELETGIEDFSKTSFSGECYDVGNFAMMIASKDLPCPSMDENIKNVIEELRAGR